MQVTKEYRTETAHRLMDYDGRCSHIHGHSYKWEITVKGGRSSNGMVIDFKDLKRIMDEVLDPFDHAIVLRGDDPFLDNLPTATNGQRQRLVIMSENPTAENMAALVGWHINNRLSAVASHAHCGVSNVKVYETATSCAECSGADILIQEYKR